MAKKRSKLGVSALVLLVSGLICKALGALFRLPLTNLLGIEGIGVFQLVMSLYAFALVVTCGGVTNALSKLISTARARGEIDKESTFLSRALLSSFCIALVLGLIFLFLGKYIAALQGIDAAQSYMLFLVLLPLGAALASLRGVFQGHENMLPTAVSQILEQVTKFGFGLLFAYFFARISVSQGVFGAFLGITLSELIAVVFLFVLFLFKNKNHQHLRDMGKIKFARSEFDRANFPLMLSASILPLVNAFDGLVIIPRLTFAGFESGFATKLFGLQTGVVGAVLNFPLIISMAVTTTLLPNISYLISRGAGGRHIIERGLKVLLFLILPTTFGLAAISKQALALVYQNLTQELLDIAFDLMLYGAFSIVLTALMQYLVMLLQANGQFRFILLITLVGGAAKAALSFALAGVKQINIFALVIGNIVLAGIVCVLALWKLKHLISFSVSFFDLSFLMLGTVAMFVTVYAFINCAYFSRLPNLLLAIALGAIVYFVVTLPFVLRLKMKQIKNV